MGLMLGNRQLAMLREMGVRVWQPAAAKAPAAPENAVDAAANAPVVQPRQALHKPSDAIDSVAARARIPLPAGTNSPQSLPVNMEPVPAPQAAARAWRMGPAQALYASPDLNPDAHSGTRWLVLLESSSDALHGDFNPLAGDAGKLLDNMLRAARLHVSGGVMLAPLLRASNDGAQAASTDLEASLPDMVSTLQPAVVLVMGRLGAQAVLQSTEPLGKLRGRVHALHGTPTIVTLEPVYLLRNPLDKAKAWEDLCLALSVVQAFSASKA
jgi:uracil-DNA glycosylase